MTKIKICGLTNIEDALVAHEAGADLLGFIFYKPSPRYVTPATGRDIIARLKEKQATAHRIRPIYVGVFVNASRPEIEQIVAHCQLDAVQLHGEESPKFVAHFEGIAYKAIRPKSTEEARQLVRQHINEETTEIEGNSGNNLPALLLDAYHPTLYGGTGHVTDWTMAANIAQQHQIMLAGSLTVDNVAPAIAAVKPWGIDVSSGVEAEKGRKDHAKVWAFVDVVRKTCQVSGDKPCLRMNSQTNSLSRLKADSKCFLGQP